MAIEQSSYIRNISLFNFRNLGNQKLEFTSGLNFIVGANGQGKTNLIEAVTLLSSIKSFRQGTTTELVGWGESSGSVFGEIWDGTDKCSRLGVVIDGKSRELFVDDVRVKSAEEYIGRFLTMAFTPLDLLLIKGPPTGRRRFMDKVVIDHAPVMLRHFLEYGHALRSKNQLLKEGVTDAHALDTWDTMLARSASAIYNSRSGILSGIIDRVVQIHLEIAPTDEQISMTLHDGFHRPLDDFSPTEIVKQLRAGRSRDIQRKSSLQGPHRADMMIQLNGRDTRLFSSQGQAKSIALALKLSALESIEQARGISPTILLDDVDSELDRQRRTAIKDLLRRTRQQVFVTGTELRDIGDEAGDREMKVFTVSKGVVAQE